MCTFSSLKIRHQIEGMQIMVINMHMHPTALLPTIKLAHALLAGCACAALHMCTQS